MVVTGSCAEPLALHTAVMAHGRRRDETMMRKRELVRLKGWLSKLTRSQRKALAAELAVIV